MELAGVLRGQKVLLFSYFKDTAIYLRASLCADQAWRVSAGDGRGGEIEVNKPGDAERWLLEQLRFDRVSVWSDSPDWSQVVAVAQREGLATILLARAGTFALPADARNQLETLRQHTRINNARRLMQLEEGLDRFDADNIPAIVLKGAALIALVYERAALRPMLDVDLLVRRDDFARAGKLFHAAGFAS